MSTTCVQLVSTYKPKSIKSLNKKAEQLINQVLPNQPYDQPIPIDCLIELNLPNVLDYQLELSDAPMHIEGAAIITSDGDKKIIIPEKTFEMAMDGDSRSRFTLAHELGHIALKHYNGETVTGNLKMSKQHIPSFKDPEWQANTFAGAILAPYVFLLNLSQSLQRQLTRLDLVNYYKLSFESAGHRLKQIHSKIDDKLWNIRDYEEWRGCYAMK